MRLPFVKVYRAFPELDRFSDAQCERYVAQARGMRADAGSTWPERLPGLVTLAVATCLAIGFCIFVPRTPFAGYAPTSEEVSYSLYWGCVVFLGGTGALLVRDGNLRAIVRRRLEADSCAKCGSSLLGKPVYWGVMRCEGCGERYDVLRDGLLAEDLLSREMAMDGRRVPVQRACGVCGSSLRALPIDRGTVTCAGCGATIRVGVLRLSPRYFRADEVLRSMSGSPFPTDRRCPRCGYSLKGLTIKDGAVSCPECAMRWSVEGLAGGADDLVALLDLTDTEGDDGEDLPDARQRPEGPRV